MGLSHEKTGYSTFNIDVQFGKPDYAISFMGLLSTMCQNSKQIGSTVVRTLAFKNAQFFIHLMPCTGIRPSHHKFFGSRWASSEHVEKSVSEHGFQKNSISFEMVLYN